MKRLWIVAVVVTFMSASGLITRAAATPPGRNGRLAYIDGVCTNNGCDFDIFTIDPDGTHTHNLTQSPEHEETVAWSPDGRRIAFYRAGVSEDLWIINSRGTSQVRLTGDRGYETMPTWSPDGGRIAFVSNQDVQEDIWVINTDGSGESDLTSDPSGSEDWPAWSPDGQTIAFVSQRSHSQKWSIELMDPDGSNRRALLSDLDGVAGLDWAPDGSQLLYSGLSDPPNFYDLYTVNVDGTDILDVTNSPTASELFPTWSPDGTLLAFFDTLLPAGVWTIQPDGDALSFVGPGLQPDWQSLP